MRFKIGDTIFDKDASGSTIANTRLELDSDEPMVVSATPEVFEFPIMYVKVEETSEALLKTRVAEVEAIFKNVASLEVIYEETNGTPLIELDTGAYPDAEIDYEIDYVDYTADIAFKFSGFGPGTTSASGAQSIVWQVEFSPNRTMGAVCEGIFVKKGGIDALSNAQAFLEGMDNGTLRPTWLPPELIMVNVVYEPQQIRRDLGAGSTADDFAPVRVTMSFKEPPQDLTILPGVIAVNYSTQMVQGEIDTRAGSNQQEQLPSNELILSGDFTVATEGNDTFGQQFNPTRIQAGGVYALAQQQIENIIAHFESTYNTFSLQKMADPTINIDHVGGVVSFIVSYFAGLVVSWDETTVIRNEEKTEFSRASDGTDWLYEPNGGPIVTLEHDLKIVSVFQPIPYRKPVGINSNWYQMGKSLNSTMGKKKINGVTVYTTQGGGVWRYVNKDPRGPSSQISNPPVDAFLDSQLPNDGLL